MATIDLQSLQLGDVSTSAKGARSIPLTSDGKAVLWTPPTLSEVAFEPTSFSGEEVSRVSLVLRATDAIVETLTALDAYVIGLLALHSIRVFGKPMTEDEVRGRWSPSLKTNPKYPTTWKMKINLQGRGEVKLWNKDKTRREPPVSWLECRAQPKVTVRGLWMMSKELGLLMEASDILLDEAPQECPFDF